MCLYVNSHKVITGVYVCSRYPNAISQLSVTTSIRIITAPGNLVALGRNLFRGLEQGKFRKVKKGGMGKCKVNGAYRAGVSFAVLLRAALTEILLLFSPLFFPFSFAFTRL